MENRSGVANFDLSSECGGYFKSSFARSMALSNTSGSKSLDYVYMDEGATIAEEAAPEAAPRPPEEPLKRMTPRRSVPTIPTYELQREFSLRASRARPNDALRFWKMKQESVRSLGSQDGGSVWGDRPQDDTKEDELTRLRKECQGLMEANRKLQQSSVSIDQGLLQAQIDTLQWQLKQAESNRQMYRAVMEQVSKFLERVHKALEGSAKAQPRSKQRVPRSRSVHTVAQSRASSPASVHRANSISQIQDSYSAFRDYACRSSRSVVVEETAPERLSQEAFRLLRTVQSLLATREPDLARLTDTEHDRRDSTSMGSCSSLLQRESEEVKTESGATPQLSVGSAEDESGFSSMSSFQDAGSGGSFHELGLPVVEGRHSHRRWSSTPADHHQPREALRVLWV